MSKPCIDPYDELDAFRRHEYAAWKTDTAALTAALDGLKASADSLFGLEQDLSDAQGRTTVYAAGKADHGESGLDASAAHSLAQARQEAEDALAKKCDRPAASGSGKTLKETVEKIKQDLKYLDEKANPPRWKWQNWKWQSVPPLMDGGFKAAEFSFGVVPVNLTGVSFGVKGTSISASVVEFNFRVVRSVTCGADFKQDNIRKDVATTVKAILSAGFTALHAAHRKKALVEEEIALEDLSEEAILNKINALDSQK